MRDIRDAQMVGRTSDGRLVQRPLSGHLSVYLNFDMVMSVGHRVTGCAIAVGTIVLVWFLVAAATGEAAYANVSWFLRTPVGYLAAVRLDRGAVVPFLRRHPPPDLGRRPDVRPAARCDRSRVVILGVDRRADAAHLAHRPALDRGSRAMADAKGLKIDTMRS